MNTIKFDISNYLESKTFNIDNVMLALIFKLCFVVNGFLWGNIVNILCVLLL